jgi:hypothetical protein
MEEKSTLTAKVREAAKTGLKEIAEVEPVTAVLANLPIY